jgi:V8-like Glu-specific endopeptidase
MHKRISLFIFTLSIYLIAVGQFPSKLDTVQQTTVQPYNNIVFLHIYRERAWPKKDGWFKSTGFLIAPNVILTAAHNIHSVGGSRVTNIKIVPAKYFNQAPYDSIQIEGEANCTNAIQTHPNYAFAQSSGKRIKHDFGIIIIPQDNLPIDFQNLPKNSFLLDSNYVVKSGDTLNVAGYPADPEYGYDGNFITYQTDTCRGVYKKSFSHQLDTYRGNSGSPIWVNSNGKRIVVGIHTFGNAATLLNKENLRLLLNLMSRHQPK